MAGIYKFRHIAPDARQERNGKHTAELRDEMQHTPARIPVQVPVPYCRTKERRVVKYPLPGPRIPVKSTDSVNAGAYNQGITGDMRDYHLVTTPSY